MTEEEIRPIAEDYVEEYCHCPDGEYTDGSLVCAGIGTALIVSRQLEKRITDLEKENAELKEQCSILADCNTCTSACKTENIEMKNNLTKAKELLKQWVELYKPKLEGYPITPIQEQTEQFLSEVEK